MRAFSGSVRVHAAILLLHPASKLWYLCRSFDGAGEGKIILTPQKLEILSESKSTIYRWLKEGQELGLFRRYHWEGNTLKIILGGLLAVCQQAKITQFGTVADAIPLTDLVSGNNRRAIASAITTKHLQECSRYAAKKQLNKLESKCFRIPEIYELIHNSQTSSNLTRGGIRGVVHRGNRRLFVGRRFVPIGVSQERIREELESQPHSCGVSERTIRRHLASLEVPKLQIMQAKREYKEIAERIKQGATHWTCKSDADISFQWSNDPEFILLHEPNGDTSSRQSGGHKIHLDQMCRYYQAYWIYRCNIYGLEYDLNSIKAKRGKLKKLRRKFETIEPVENSILEIPPQTPQESNHPDLTPEGSHPGGQNKADKNKNSQNPDTEPNSFAPGGDGWEKLKAKLLAGKSERLEQRWNRLRGV